MALPRESLQSSRSSKKEGAGKPRTLEVPWTAHRSGERPWRAGGVRPGDGEEQTDRLGFRRGRSSHFQGVLLRGARGPWEVWGGRACSR